MLYTTTPTFIVVLAILLFMGTSNDAGIVSARPAEVRRLLLDNFEINWAVALLPILVMLFLSLRRYAPEVCMTASTFVCYSKTGQSRKS